MECPAAGKPPVQTHKKPVRRRRPAADDHRHGHRHHGQQAQRENLQRSLAQLRELSDHQQTIKEEERRRIALDIHDDLDKT
jgi:signal transduction histidine kinase